jgi:hypothetical protein
MYVRVVPLVGLAVSIISQSMTTSHDRAAAIKAVPLELHINKSLPNISILFLLQ